MVVAKKLAWKPRHVHRRNLVCHYLGQGHSLIFPKKKARTEVRAEVVADAEIESRFL